MAQSFKLSIIIPVKNEVDNLKLILRIIPAIVEVPHEIIVVYDNQEDNSIPVINSLKRKHTQIRGLHNKLGKGVLNAVKSGIKESRGRYILITAADDIGPLLAIEDMVSLMDQGCKLVSCTRYSNGGKVLGGSPIGRPLSRIANSIFRRISCAALTDSTIGIKMFNRDIFNKMTLEARPIGFAFAFEMAIKAQIAGMRLGEVPIISLNRLYGKSSFAFGPWIKEYSRWFLYGLKNYSKLRKTKGNVISKIPQKMMEDRM